MDDKVQAQDNISSGYITRPRLEEAVEAPRFEFTIECRDKDGNLKWTEVTKNTVTTEGKNDLLTKYFKGSAYTAAWYAGLISSVGYTAIAATDTAAQINGTNGWNEAATANAPDYDEATRVALTFGTASAGALATSAASAFTINESGTVKGAFVCSVSTKDGTTGTLYSAALFTPGDRAVVATDTINVSATLTVS